MNVVYGRIPHKKQSLQGEEAQKRRAKTIADKIVATKSSLQNITRGISENDRVSLALNLGDLIKELAHSEVFSGDKKKALKQVWDKWGQKDFSKRLRYIRFQGEKVSKEEVISSSGMDFIKLAETIADLGQSPNISQEDLRNEYVRRLLVNTSFDIDPLQNAKVDFDAIRELGEILEQMKDIILEQVPGISEYFRRSYEHNIHYYSGKTQTNLGGGEIDIFNTAIAKELIDNPKIYGYKAAFALAEDDDEGGFKNIFPFDGFSCDETDVGGDIHFPKVHLGSISITWPLKCVRIERNQINEDYIASYQATETWSNTEEYQSHIENLKKFEANVLDKLFNEISNFSAFELDWREEDFPTQILNVEVFLAFGAYFVGDKITYGWYINLWPCPSITVENKSCLPHLDLNKELPVCDNQLKYLMPEVNIQMQSQSDFIYFFDLTNLDKSMEEFLLWASGWGHHEQNIFHGHVIWGHQSKTARRILGENLGEWWRLSKHHFEGWDSSIMNFAVDAPVELKTHENTIDQNGMPNFKQKIATEETFAPISAGTLAGKIVRNVLYAPEKDNILNGLVEDAKIRVEHLDKHFQEWNSQYENAKVNLKNKFARKELPEGNDS